MVRGEQERSGTASQSMSGEPHRCEKLLLALIMANERRNWPKAVMARPAKPKNLVSPEGGLQSRAPFGALT